MCFLLLLHQLRRKAAVEKIKPFSFTLFEIVKERFLDHVCQEKRMMEFSLWKICFPSKSKQKKKKKHFDSTSV